MMPRLWLALKPLVARHTEVCLVMTGLVRLAHAGSRGSSLLP
jgi:hypothetical protein